MSCVYVSRFLLIFCKYDTQCNVYNYLPLQPPLMPLGLSFNQYGLYPCVSFWSPSLSRDLVISQLVGLMTCYVPIRISSLGKSLTISMKQRADRLLLRIYFAPYGRTYDVVMNMCPVHMSCHNKCVLPFCESHAGFISDFICFLRCDFSRFEGLADLICNHISLRLPPCLMQIFFFCLSSSAVTLSSIRFDLSTIPGTLFQNNIPEPAFCQKQAQGTASVYSVPLIFPIRIFYHPVQFPKCLLPVPLSHY